MRPLPVIEAELKAASEGMDRMRRAVSILAAERLEYLRAREARILADFDAGMAREALIHKHGVSSNTLGSIMHRNGRRYRGEAIPISHLPAEKQRHYIKLRRAGINPLQARQIVSETVS